MTSTVATIVLLGIGPDFIIKSRIGMTSDCSWVLMYAAISSIGERVGDNYGASML